MKRDEREKKNAVSKNKIPNQESFKNVLKYVPKHKSRTPTWAFWIYWQSKIKQANKKFIENMPLSLKRNMFPK